MKKFSLLLTLAVLMVSSSVFAGSIDYLSNQSAKYLMTLAGRAAATDGADIVSYNPAGTALMGEGFFIDVSNQTLLKPYSQENKLYYNNIVDLVNIDEEYTQDTATWLLPNVYLAYNAGQVGIGKLAVYGQLGVVAGGGSLEWDGSAGADLAAFKVAANASGTALSTVTQLTSLEDVKVEGSSVYYAIGAGASYAFLEDMISISAGARYTIAKRSGAISGIFNYASTGGALNGQTWALDVDTEYDYDAEGITPIFGFDVKPIKELTIGFKYEMETKLEFEYDQKSNDVIASCSTPAFAPTIQSQVADGLATQLNMDKKKANSNLPQIIAIGVEYVVTPELVVSTGAQIYFVGDADMEGYEDNFGTGYEVSLAATYKVMEPLKVGFAVMYTDQGAKDELLESTDNINTVSGNPVLNSIFVGLGATYTVIPNLDLTLAGGWVHYLPEEVDVPLAAGTMEVKYSKEVYNIALGASYKI